MKKKAECTNDILDEFRNKQTTLTASPTPYTSIKISIPYRHLT